MEKELFSLGDKIRLLREKSGLTQAALARELGISRSGVNAWEMGLSVPQVQYIVALAKQFKVSSDYILGIEETSSVSISGLTEKQMSAVIELINCFRSSD
ncbi:MAG: helix-turn-helix transcriptional regulator [Ruminococcus sp.]|nr:helix-turn-helix transcriptional regulator [Ruminococcus sp.]